MRPSWIRDFSHVLAMAVRRLGSRDLAAVFSMVDSMVSTKELDQRALVTRECEISICRELLENGRYPTDLMDTVRHVTDSTTRAAIERKPKLPSPSMPQKEAHEKDDWTVFRATRGTQLTQWLEDCNASLSGVRPRPLVGVSNRPAVARLAILLHEAELQLKTGSSRLGAYVLQLLDGGDAKGAARKIFETLDGGGTISYLRRQYPDLLRPTKGALLLSPETSRKSLAAMKKHWRQRLAAASLVTMGLLRFTAEESRPPSSTPAADTTPVGHQPSPLGWAPATALAMFPLGLLGLSYCYNIASERPAASQSNNSAADRFGGQAEATSIAKRDGGLSPTPPTSTLARKDPPGSFLLEECLGIRGHPRGSPEPLADAEWCVGRGDSMECHDNWRSCTTAAGPDADCYPWQWQEGQEEKVRMHCTECSFDHRSRLGETGSTGYSSACYCSFSNDSDGMVLVETFATEGATTAPSWSGTGVGSRLVLPKHETSTPHTYVFQTENPVFELHAAFHGSSGVVRTCIRAVPSP